MTAKKTDKIVRHKRVLDLKILDVFLINYRRLKTPTGVIVVIDNRYFTVNASRSIISYIETIEKCPSLLFKPFLAVRQCQRFSTGVP
jgi:hypothetical protein